MAEDGEKKAGLGPEAGANSQHQQKEQRPPVSDASISRLAVAASENPHGAMRTLAGVHERESDPDAEAESRRRQDKIVTAIVSGDEVPGIEQKKHIYRVILELPSASLGPDTKEKYFAKVRAGEITDDVKRELVHVWKLPNASRDALATRTPNAALDTKLSYMDNQMKGIVAELSKGGLKNRDTLNAQDLVDFLGKGDVIAFDAAQEQFLGKIGVKNGQQKREEYKAAYDRLGKEMFGRQWIYLQEMKALDQQALQTIPAVPPTERHQPTLHEQRAAHADTILPTQDWIRKQVLKLKLPTRIYNPGEKQQYGDSTISRRGAATIRYAETSTRIELDQQTPDTQISYTMDSRSDITNFARSQGMESNNYLTVENPNTQNNELTHYFIDAQGQCIKVQEDRPRTPRVGVAASEQWKSTFQIAPVSQDEIRFMERTMKQLKSELEHPAIRIAKRFLGRPVTKAA